MLSRVLMLTVFASASVLVSPAAQAAEKKKPLEDADKIVCKSETIVGSHMSTRVCKTKAEWAEGKRAAHDAFDQNRDKWMRQNCNKDGGAC